MKTLHAAIRLPLVIGRLFMDPRMPFGPKLLLTMATLYLLLPMEMMPDRAFGALGYADDVALIVLAIAWFLNRAPASAIERARERR